MSSVVANNLFSSNIMDNESYRSMKKYDGFVRSNIATGMSIEQAVETADYMYENVSFNPNLIPIINSFCIYIPRMCKYNTEEYVRQQLSFLGEIKRIDFVRNKNFVTKEVDDTFKRAFVHFNYGNENAKNVLYSIQTSGQYTYMPTTYHPTNPSFTEVWYLKYAEDPVLETDMNIHQLAHVYDIIDDKVIDVEQKMFQQDVVIEQLEKKSDYMEEQIRVLQRTILEFQDYHENLTNEFDYRINEAEQRSFQQDVVIEQLEEKNNSLEEQVRQLQETTQSMQNYLDIFSSRINDLIEAVGADFAAEVVGRNKKTIVVEEEKANVTAAADKKKEKYEDEDEYCAEKTNNDDYMEDNEYMRKNFIRY